MKAVKRLQVRHRLLLGIFLLAAVLRLYQLGDIPSHPNPDEVSNGYNAFSIFKTGADEYGHRFPALLQAYNDWRPALYAYFSIPFIAFFGLTTFAIRLPSVVLSLGTMLFLYFLVRDLVKTRKDNFRIFKQMVQSSELISQLAVLLFAILPWNINISRLSNEINLSLFLLVSGIFMLLRFVTRKQARFLFTAAILFALCFSSYNATKLFLPFFLSGLGIILQRKLFKNKRILLISTLLFLLFLLPTIWAFAQPGAFSRFGGVSIFSQREDIVTQSAKRSFYDRQNNNYFGLLVDNRRVGFALAFVNNYLETLNPGWLFAERYVYPLYKVPQFGPLYLFSITLLLFGLYSMIKRSPFDKRTYWVLSLWFFTALIPAGLTTDAPHIVRTFHIIPVLTIVQAVGALVLIRWVLKIKQRQKLTAMFMLIIPLFFFFWFVHSYFVNFKREIPLVYQDKVTDALSYAVKHENEYDKVIVSLRGNLPQSYMYYLFITKYDPIKYQQRGGTKSAAFHDTHIIGKYEFRPPELFEGGSENLNVSRRITKKTLLLLSPLDLQGIDNKPFDANFRIIKTFSLYTGEPVILLVKRK